uniref:Uncharacterized protein n=1 Tax=Faecalibaculum rodentium TaxID=1702221 RepID=A0A140DS16_9FIRM|nr:hypothetical protein AALO17_03090 [Faecalibaculum rodentium]
MTQDSRSVLFHAVSRTIYSKDIAGTQTDFSLCPAVIRGMTTDGDFPVF